MEFIPAQLIFTFSYENVIVIFRSAFCDVITLCADKAFSIEYVYGSMRLESNNGLGGLTINDSHPTIKDDVMFLSFSDLAFA